MRHLGIVIGGIMLTCSGCVVHQAVPVAMPANEMAPAGAPPAAATARNCREFQDTVIVGGVKQPAYGTTCQQPDGSWQITSSPNTGAPPSASAPPTASAAPYPYPYPYPVYPAYPYPYYGYPYGYPYYGPSVGVGFRFGGRWH